MLLLGRLIFFAAFCLVLVQSVRKRQNSNGAGAPRPATKDSLANSENSNSCQSVCYEDAFPPCGAWVVADSAQEAAGAYQLGEGVANLTCAFTSSPEPVVIKWLHRAEFESEWRQLTCSSLELLENCKINKAGDHRVTSTCLLRMDRLTLSGSYKCLAVDKNSNNQLAAGAEAALSVIGIANVTIVKSSLWHGSFGFVHVQVCANPRPELIWMTREGNLVQSGASTDRYTALGLLPVRESSTRTGRALTVPYCYRARLGISKIGREDHRIKVAVRNEVDLQIVSLNLNILGLPSSAQQNSLLSLCLFAVVFLTFDMM